MEKVILQRLSEILTPPVEVCNGTISCRIDQDFCELLYSPLGEVPRYTAPTSVVNEAFERMQSISVIPSGSLWQEALARTTWDDTGIISASAGLAREEVQKVEELRKREALRGLLKSWREEGDEQELHETWECLRLALHEDGFC